MNFVRQNKNTCYKNKIKISFRKLNYNRIQIIKSLILVSKIIKVKLRQSNFISEI